MKFPTPITYSDYRRYFADFLQTNRENTSNFSLRLFAKGIGWPHALIRDLARGYKRLTVLRALEFSKFAAFDPFTTEHLVYLALADDTESAVRNHFENLVRKSRFDPEISIDLEDSVLFRDAAAFAIYSYIASCKQTPSAEEIATALYTFDMDSQQVEDIISELISDGAFSTSGGQLQVKDRSAFFREDPRAGSERNAGVVRLHKAFLQNLVRCLDEMARPRFFVGGYALLTKEEFGEARENGMRWLRAIESRSDQHFHRVEKEIQKDSSDDSALYQYSTVLVPITRSHQAKNSS